MSGFQQDPGELTPDEMYSWLPKDRKLGDRLVIEWVPGKWWVVEVTNPHDLSMTPLWHEDGKYGKAAAVKWLVEHPRREPMAELATVLGAAAVDEMAGRDVNRAPARELDASLVEENDGDESGPAHDELETRGELRTRFRQSIEIIKQARRITELERRVDSLAKWPGGVDEAGNPLGNRLNDLAAGARTDVWLSKLTRETP